MLRRILITVTGCIPILAILLPLYVFAQYPDTTGSYRYFPDLGDQTRGMFLGTGPSQPLEHPVDPARYMVGPGDVLMVSIWGAVEVSFPLPVLPQGHVIIPTVGLIAVSDLTLETVGTRIAERGRTVYPNAEITTSLDRLRTFAVHVVGEVFAAGNLAATPADRVSNLILKAGGVTTWADKRAIRIQRRDGTTARFDYLGYLREGTMEHNIELRAGDVITVPRVDISRQAVYLDGNVLLPGYYPIDTGETLGSLLQRAIVKREDTDWDNAFIERIDADGNPGLTRIPLDFTHPTGGADAATVTLQAGDKILLPRRLDQVYVTGAVQNPGPYPFRVNLRAIDYVGMAGKREESVDADRLKVIRRDNRQVEVGGELIIERGDIIEVSTRKSQKVLRFMQIAGPVSSIIIAVVAVISVNRR